uniref:Uncharacterized protein n=1 Tax=Rhizophora mucronata TaxID=61149 RepID=A0A2P2QVY4_RHIMU
MRTQRKFSTVQALKMHQETGY